MAEHTSAHPQDWYDHRAIGARLRHVRTSRRQTLRVVAELAGISAPYLCKIETGKMALDSWKLLFALANALRVAPSDLTNLPLPRPTNEHTDSSIAAVRRALMAVTAGRPGGEVRSVEQLRYRYRAAVDGDCANRGAVLPGLIADLHTTLAQRREMAELIPLAVLLHGGPTWAFLYVVGAPMDLRWQNVTLARTLAEELDDPIMLGFVARGAANVMIGSGAFDLARAELDVTTVPTTTNEGRTVNGMLALHQSLVAAAERKPAESAAALEHAGELAARTTGDTFTMGFGPVNVGLWRMGAALELGDPDKAIQVAKTVNPQEHPYPSLQATYWMDYGNALTRVRRRDDAARAMLRAERLHPVKVLRYPRAMDTLAELVAHPPKNAALGSAIRGMAHRAGLPL